MTQELDSAAPQSGSAEDDTSRHLRGSSLLTAGRGISLLVNFGVQVLIVRYLSQEGYGAFAYALSIVAVGQSLVTLGLDRAVTRFVPIYEERGQYDRLFGTLVLSAGTVVALGVAFVITVVALQGWLAGSVVDRQIGSVLAILAVLAPVQAYDGLLVGMFAVFGNAWAIFLRKHVLGPLLKLGAVLALISVGSGVEFLAAGYVAAGFVGIVLYSILLWRLLVRRGLLGHLRNRGISLPYREVFGFALPLLSSDLVYVVLSASDVILLEHFHDAAEVASFRVVHSAAVLNQLVFTSFALLFTPVAARMFAREDHVGINQLYWRTATWLAVFSFPIFALTFSLAGPVTVTLYGERYADSALYLALLSLGYYFNVALGFNGLTLKVVGRLRYIVSLNVLAAVANVGLNLLLIPQFGALGAAIGTSATLIIHNVLKQAGLGLTTGIQIFAWSTLRVYGVIAVAIAFLAAVAALFELNVVTQLALTAGTAVIVLLLNRRVLRLGDTFPALVRNRLGRRIFGPGT
ncbi:MAG TPA: flippase [Thermomicrobiales bacterium]|nr:flippase [Thermomicrobiales bacterium]